LEPSNENKSKLLEALKTLDFQEEDLIYLAQLNFKEHQVFSIGSEPYKIDFLTKINQISFENVAPNVVFGEFEGMKLPIISLNDLILSKINTGRTKDNADIQELKKIKK
jgi:nicotinic acid phosphoribosyltransferase